MSVDRHDDDFVATLDRDRPLLRGTAYLLTGDDRTADDRARLGARRISTSAARRASSAWRRSAAWSARPPEPAPCRGPAPRVRAGGRAGDGARDPIVADLARLDRDQRAVIVLERFTPSCPACRSPTLLDRPVDEVLVLARQARVTLASGHADRDDDIALAR